MQGLWISPGLARSELDRVANLFRDRLGEAGEKVVAVFVVEPQSFGRVPIVVVCVRAGREPHLLHLRLAAQDELCAGGELNRDDAVGRGEIHFVWIEVLEPLRDFAEARIRALAKFAVIHAEIVSTNESTRYAMTVVI